MKWIANMGRGPLALGCLAMAGLIMLSVNYISASAFRHVKADLTEEKLFTITDGTRQVVRELDEPIDLKLYYSKQLGELAPKYAHYFERIRGLLEQYRDISSGKLKVSYIEPEPFSDNEDRAVAAGLRGIRLNLEGDMGYFGLVGTNSTDNRGVIQFFAPDRERFLEYDLTKLVHTLANPKKPSVGIISGIGMDGRITPQGHRSPSWQIAEQIKELFDVYQLDQNLKEIPDDVEMLMVVHPNKLTEQAAYAIDQFALKGGRILAFVDPLAEEGQSSPYMMGSDEQSEEFRKLLESWGVKFDPKRVATDVVHARRVQFGMAPGTKPTITEHIAWLTLGKDNLEQDDVLSSGIERINVATAGILEKKEGASITFTPILQTSPQSMAVDAAEFGFGADPVKLLRNFRSGEKPLAIAARISGYVDTAFPDGRPIEEKDDEKKVETTASNSKSDSGAASHHVKDGEINAIIVADTDLLHDRFWVEVGNFLGQTVMVPNAHNATFVLNSLDNLAGSSSLLALRGRGVDDRPFELVDDLRKQAERRFRRKEEALVARLEGLQKKLADIERKGSDGEAILSEKDRDAIETFRRDIVQVRRELREVKRALREDIDLLEGTLKFTNIAGVPLLIALGGIAAIIRRRRHRG